MVRPGAAGLSAIPRLPLVTPVTAADVAPATRAANGRQTGLAEQIAVAAI
jgi:hypothetical protein